LTLKPLVVREAKAFIKNPAFILSIVLIIAFYGLMGKMVSTGIQTAVEQTMGIHIGVVLRDSSNFTMSVLSLVNQTIGGRLKIVDSVDSGLSSYDVVLVIPQNFSTRALEPGMSIQLEAYVKIDSISPVVSGAKAGLASTIGDLIRKSVSLIIAMERNIDPSLIDKPVFVNSTIQVYGKSMSIEEYSAFTSFMSFIPLMIAIIMGINAMYASQFTAIEKVEKAFEMLLAQPIPRRNIVLAKIIGSIISSLIMGGAYFAGMLLVLMGATSTPPPAQGVQSVGFNPGELIYGKIGFNSLLIFVGSIVLGLMYSGALGVILGSIVSDERIAGAFTAPILFIFIGIAYALVFVGLPINTITGVIAGFTIAPLPAVVVVSSMTSKLEVLAVSIGLALLSTVMIIILAVHIFNRDIVILGVRLGKFKHREKS
jgi:ABC-2 type transport system permease protein